MTQDNAAELTACVVAMHIANLVRKRTGGFRQSLVAYDAARDVLRAMMDSASPLETLEEVALLEQMWAQT